VGIPLVSESTSPPLAELYARYGEAIRRYALRRVGAGSADDVVSEVFLVDARGKRPRTVDEALPWLYAVAYREVLRHRSTAGRVDRLHNRLRSFHREGAAPDPGETITETDWVAGLIDRLPTKDAELLRLVVFEQLDVPAAARILRITAAAAHTRLHRIRRKVQGWMDERPNDTSTLRPEIRPMIRPEMRPTTLPRIRPTTPPVIAAEDTHRRESE